jgi:cytochrome c oxidase assembly factor CtaG
MYWSMGSSMRSFYFDVLSSFASAHGREFHGQPLLFKLKFPFDPTLIFFIALAWLYARGLRKFGSYAPITKSQVRAFYAGVVILCGAYLPPIDPIADQLFSMHMLQHLLITSVGVPLLTLGAPWFICLRGVPTQLRRKWIIPVLRNGATRIALGQIRRPLVAAFLFEGVMWFWHLPYFYNRALLNDGIHIIEHVCMALAAINLWRVLIQAEPSLRPVPHPLRIAIIGLMTTMDIALSAALTYSSRVWYAYDQLALPEWWKWDRLSDQQLGGLLMWVPGSFVWITALAFIFYSWTYVHGSGSSGHGVGVGSSLGVGVGAGEAVG